MENLKQRYTDAYDFMARSSDTDNMMLFGKVLTEMMDWMIVNKPVYAMELIEKLESVRWKNYLTQKEADAIVEKMEPQPSISKNEWVRMMSKMEFDLFEEPYYNCWALYATMMMKDSDCRTSIAKLMGKAPGEIAPEEMIEATHLLAIDVLKDKDGRFDVRKYFEV